MAGRIACTYRSHLRGHQTVRALPKVAAIRMHSPESLRVRTSIPVARNAPAHDAVLLFIEARRSC